MTLAYRHLLAVALFVPFLLAPAVLVAAARYALDTLHDRLRLDAEEMEKPLPDLPAGTASRARRTSSNLALTVEARAHLHHLISRLLEEEGDIRDKETWAERLEASLYDLGGSMERGGWLAGFRRARYVRKRHHDEEEKRRVEEQARKDKGEQEQAKNRTAKGKSKLKESVVEEPAAEDVLTNEQLAASLEQLRDLASKPVPPTPKPSAKHLLLTVSGPPASEPSEDMGFKLVRASIHCAFRPGEFVLPKAIDEEDTIDPVVLYGLENWDCKYKSVCILRTRPNRSQLPSFLVTTPYNWSAARSS